jgi:uncharacterized protein YwqG
VDPENKTPPKIHHSQGYGCTLSGFAFLAGLYLAIKWSPSLGIGVCAAAAFFGWRSEKKDSARLAARDARFKKAGPLTGDVWRRLLDGEGLRDVVDDVAQLVRDALRIVTKRVESVPRGASRVGGVPDLPPGMAWPRHKGVPLAFLAQFNLEEVAGILPESPLPHMGHLWFFYDVKSSPSGSRQSDAGGAIVLYGAGDAESLEPRESPEDSPKKSRFTLCAVSFESYQDIPDLANVPAVDERLEKGYRDESYDEIRSLLAFGAHTQRPSKLLGFADPVQDVMELECEHVTSGQKFGMRVPDKVRRKELERAGREWRLLFQLDSDDNAGMMWGDAGCLYFWIRDEDLRARRFDRTWMMFQCG